MAFVEAFGSVPAGPAKLFTLANDKLRVRITDFGARMVSIEAPDADGHLDHVLLGFACAEDYVAAGGSFGAILGRYANRIADGAFVLDGEPYHLAVNDAGGTLHGGPAGFGQVLWALEDFDEASATLTLRLDSPDGDQGFPGALTAQVVYRLDGDTLRIDLSAVTDRPTICNLSAHPYFNLGRAAGRAAGNDVLSHVITIDADRFLPVDARQIPTGDIHEVAGTAFDFRKPKVLGADIRSPDPQLRPGRGYDHCFVLNGAGMRLAATAIAAGRRLDVFTTQPGLQLYTGNSLDGSRSGRDGMAFRQSDGFALEAQNFPNAPNCPDFPDSILRPGTPYRHSIAYRFSAA